MVQRELAFRLQALDHCSLGTPSGMRTVLSDREISPVTCRSASTSGAISDTRPLAATTLNFAFLKTSTGSTASTIPEAVFSTCMVRFDAVHRDDRLLAVGLAKDERSVLDGDLRLVDGPGDVALGRALLLAQGLVQPRQLHVQVQRLVQADRAARGDLQIGVDVREADAQPLVMQPAVAHLKANLGILCEPHDVGRLFAVHVGDQLGPAPAAAGS